MEKFDDRMGFWVDKDGHAYCTKCLNDNRYTIGRFQGGKKLYCPSHKEVFEGGSSPEEIQEILDRENRERNLILQKNNDSDDGSTWLRFNDVPSVWLSSFTSVAFEVNAAYEATPDLNMPFHEVFKAAEGKKLVSYLAQAFGDICDFSLLFNDSQTLSKVEDAFMNAAETLRGRVSRKTGVKSSGFGLVMAIVLEAIQQQYSQFIFQAIQQSQAFDECC